MSLTLNDVKHQLEKPNFISYFKNAFFIVSANYYFYIVMMIIYGFSAEQPFHYQYSVLHAIESLVLILFLAVLNIGVILVMAAKLLNITSKVLYFLPPLYCFYIDLSAPPSITSRLTFIFSNFEELASVALLFAVTFVADKMLRQIHGN